MTIQTQDSNVKATTSKEFLSELKKMINDARQSVATTVNATLSLLYWQIGYRIHRELLKEGRAQYGQHIVATVSQQLVAEYGKGFA